MAWVVTEKGEQGATTTRTIAPGSGSWWAPMARSVSARISSSGWTTESGGSPPSFSDRLIEPREAWKRMPTSAAARTWSSIDEPLGHRYWWSKAVVHPDSASSARAVRVAVNTASGVRWAQMG